MNDRVVVQVLRWEWRQRFIVTVAMTERNNSGRLVPIWLIREYSTCTCLDAAQQLEEDELRLRFGEHLFASGELVVRQLLLHLEQLVEQLAALRAARTLVTILKIEDMQREKGTGEENSGGGGRGGAQLEHNVERPVRTHNVLHADHIRLSQIGVRKQCNVSRIM